MKLRFIMVFLLIIPSLAISKYKILKQSAQSVLVEIRLENFQEHVFEINGNIYHLYQFEDGNCEDKFGNPAIPILLTRLAFPVGAEISYQLIAAETENRRNVTIIPRGIFSLPEGNPLQMMNDEIYNADFPYPEIDIDIGEPYDYRGVNVIINKNS